MRYLDGGIQFVTASIVQREGRFDMLAQAHASEELARQIASFQPSLLVLFELSEFALYQIEQEFASLFPNIRIACVVGDVKDAARLDGVFATYKPAVVFHG